MFVGYEVKSNVGSAKPVVLETDIKLSQAVLDPAGKVNKKDPVCVMVEHNKKQFILAVLDPAQSWQCPLDLMFAAGSEVKFFLRGSGTVHLTGFEYREDMEDIDMSMSSDDEDEVSEDEGLFALNERKSKLKALENGVKSNKKKETGVKPSAKGDQPDSDDDEDDEDDEDFDEFAGDEDDSDLDAFGEESSEDEDEEMDDNDTLGQLDEGDSDDDDDDEDEESD